MTEIPSGADINCTAEKIFDVITDFRGQDRWLTQASAFHVKRSRVQSLQRWPSRSRSLTVT